MFTVPLLGIKMTFLIGPEEQAPFFKLNVSWPTEEQYTNRTACFVMVVWSWSPFRVLLCSNDSPMFRMVRRGMVLLVTDEFPSPRM